ncbi:MAG: hypothetical protein COA91_13210 [Robiginitomaculum sp.]|nr:MAG: hypothetical protein COA91_13210 [Robiginitomaculum sp.]
MLVPFLVAFSTTHIGSPDWTPHARFHLAASSFGHVLALPIMLYAIWCKTLFGTGRSVRLMAYLGLAYVLGVFIAGTFRQKLGLEYYDLGQQVLIMGFDGSIFIKGLVFVILLLGIFFSVRRGADNI